LLLTRIAWLIISVIVLRLTTTSAATVGVLDQNHEEQHPVAETAPPALA
jgi:hypothetical protein